MKKPFIIFLSFFVLIGLLFAEELPDAAMLTLNTAVAEQVYHGFFSEIPDPSIVFGEQQAISNTVSGVILNASDVNFGYYVLYTNLPSQVKVSFSLSSLTKVVEDDVWYVPFKLLLNQAGQDGGRFESDFFSGKTFGSDTYPSVGGTDPLTNLGGDVFTTSGSGKGYVALKLTASFNSGNLDLIPSGSYVGSIVASITSL